MKFKSLLFTLALGLVCQAGFASTLPTDPTPKVISSNQIKVQITFGDLDHKETPAFVALVDLESRSAQTGFTDDAGVVFFDLQPGRTYSLQAAKKGLVDSTTILRSDTTLTSSVDVVVVNMISVEMDDLVLKN